MGDFGLINAAKVSVLAEPPNILLENFERDELELRVGFDQMCGNARYSRQLAGAVVALQRTPFPVLQQAKRMNIGLTDEIYKQM